MFSSSVSVCAVFCPSGMGCIIIERGSLGLFSPVFVSEIS